jgi:dimethylhistidine N-methyltransferase
MVRRTVETSIADLNSPAPPRIVDRVTTDALADRSSLCQGLLAAPAAIAPKYFYDAQGCALFGAICELPEYYPTRTERAIFDRHRVEIAQEIGRGTQFVDLGAGDGSKAQPWMPVVAPVRYVAVDIARHAIAKTLSAMATLFPGTEMVGLVTDLARGLDLADVVADGPVTLFYPGSSIGNFAPGEAIALLRDVRRYCGCESGGGLLIGVDTKKDPLRLARAYDDALGVTAAFNRNVLRHVNRILGCDFRPEAYAHRAFYNDAAGRIEMHLEAKVAQVVDIDGTLRTFVAGERIHTENSYKYAPSEFAAMLDQAGFARVKCWQDAHGDFAVFHAR